MALADTVWSFISSIPHLIAHAYKTFDTQDWVIVGGIGVLILLVILWLIFSLFEMISDLVGKILSFVFGSLFRLIWGSIKGIGRLLLLPLRWRKSPPPPTEEEEA